MNNNEKKQGKYDDIINLPHHVSLFHKPMSMESRAAQFAPFAALGGHNEAISETARRNEKSYERINDENMPSIDGLTYNNEY